MHGQRRAHERRAHAGRALAVPIALALVLALVLVGVVAVTLLPETDARSGEHVAPLPVPSDGPASGEPRSLRAVARRDRAAEPARGREGAIEALVVEPLDFRADPLGPLSWEIDLTQRPWPYGAALSGTVIGDEGRPVRGAAVHLLDPDLWDESNDRPGWASDALVEAIEVVEFAEAVVHTDADGRFRFGGLDSVEWTLLATAPGREGRCVDGVSALDGPLTVHLRAEARAELRVILPPADAEGSGEEVEPPVVRALRPARVLGPVLVGPSLGERQGERKLATTVGADGQVTVSGIGPLGTRIEILAADGSGAAAMLPPAQPGERLSAEIRLAPPLTVTGVVRDGNTEPVAGAVVSFLPIGDGWSPRHVVADETGRYAAHVPAADWLVSARLGGAPRGRSRLLELDAAQQPPVAGFTLDLRAHRGCSLGVRCRDAAGFRADEVFLDVEEENGWRRVATGSSSPDAGLVFGELRPGHYAIGTVAEDGVAEVEVTLGVDGETRSVALELPTTARVTGVVTDRGVRAAGVVVRAAGPVEPSEVTTGSDGKFAMRLLTGVDEHTTTLTVLADGAECAGQTIPAAPGDATHVGLAIHTGELRVRVLDDRTDEGVPGLMVDITPSVPLDGRQPRSTGNPRAVTDADGWATFPRVPVSERTLEVSCEVRRHLSRAGVRVAPNGISQIVLGTEACGGVTGRVVTDPRLPADHGLSVYAWGRDHQGRPIRWFADVDAAGGFFARDRGGSLLHLVVIPSWMDETRAKLLPAVEVRLQPGELRELELPFSAPAGN